MGAARGASLLNSTGPMSQASVIVSSYNYAHYLRQAVDSALAQVGDPPEVIVVDDGSTDDSRSIIQSYGARITPVFKDNGGQASSLNAGLAVSHGDIILFLDSDDALRPDAVIQARELLRDPLLVKAHWKVIEIDSSGAETERFLPL